MRFAFEKAKLENSVKCVSKYNVGDVVVVKPPGTRCSTKWNRGQVTKVGEYSIDVDGIPRHISDIRKLDEDDQEDELIQGNPGHVGGVSLDVSPSEMETGVGSRPVRNVGRPRRFDDYEL